jgi:hypothetical protein
METGSTVRVVRSPYRGVKRGEVGEIVERLRVESPRHILVVRFKDGKEWQFFPGELVVLPGPEVPAEGGQKEEQQC